MINSYGAAPRSSAVRRRRPGAANTTPLVKRTVWIGCEWVRYET